MKKLANLALTIVVTLLLGAIIYVAARQLFGMDETAAKGAASFPILTIPKIFEELDNISASCAGERTIGATPVIQNLESYGLPWWILLLVAPLIIIAVNNAVSFFAGAGNS